MPNPWETENKGEKREAKIGNQSFAGKTPNFRETVEEKWDKILAFAKTKNVQILVASLSWHHMPLWFHDNVYRNKENLGTFMAVTSELFHMLFRFQVISF